MKSADVKSGMCIEHDVYHNKKDPKFRVGDVIISNTVILTYVIGDFEKEKVVGRFMKNNYERQIKQITEMKKSKKKNVVNGMEKGKTMIITLTAVNTYYK